MRLLAALAALRHPPRAATTRLLTAAAGAGFRGWRWRPPAELQQRLVLTRPQGAAVGATGSDEAAVEAAAAEAGEAAAEPVAEAMQLGERELRSLLRVRCWGCRAVGDGMWCCVLGFVYVFMSDTAEPKLDGMCGDAHATISTDGINPTPPHPTLPAQSVCRLDGAYAAAGAEAWLADWAAAYWAHLHPRPLHWEAHTQHTGARAHTEAEAEAEAGEPTAGAGAAASAGAAAEVLYLLATLQVCTMCVWEYCVCVCRVGGCVGGCGSVGVAA